MIFALGSPVTRLVITDSANVFIKGRVGSCTEGQTTVPYWLYRQYRGKKVGAARAAPGAIAQVRIPPVVPIPRAQNG